MPTQKTRREEREREREREMECVRAWERETPGPLDPFLSAFPPPGPALWKLGYPGVLFILPEVLTLVLGPSFVVFRGLFPSCLLATAVLDSFFLYYLPNQKDIGNF